MTKLGERPNEQFVYMVQVELAVTVVVQLHEPLELCDVDKSLVKLRVPRLWLESCYWASLSWDGNTGCT